MSYNIPVFETSSFNCYEMVSPDDHLLFDLPFSNLYYDSSDYNLQSLMNHQRNPIDESTCSSDQFVSLSGPPLTDQLENLSLYETTPLFPSLLFDPHYSPFKDEECQADFDPFNYNPDVENVANYLQRSFSSISFEAKPNFSFQPSLDSLMEASQNFHGQASFSLPENTFFAGHMRKVSSTGDLENMRNVNGGQRSISTTLMEEAAPFKVGRYNPEERQERISKYRAKRHQRNFNKTIKYACRKTLADNRPRVRGRFTRNDENVEIPKVACNSTRDDDEDELWVLHDVEDEIMARGTFMNGISQQHQFQYHHGCF